jgi:hypothetical protein
MTHTDFHFIRNGIQNYIHYEIIYVNTVSFLVRTVSLRLRVRFLLSMNNLHEQCPLNYPFHTKINHQLITAVFISSMLCKYITLSTTVTAFVNDTPHSLLQSTITYYNHGPELSAIIGTICHGLLTNRLAKPWMAAQQNNCVCGSAAI